MVIFGAKIELALKNQLASYLILAGFMHSNYFLLLPVKLNIFKNILIKSKYKFKAPIVTT